MAAIAALLLAPATALAHSYFIQSDPGDGSILSKPPAEVVLVFSSPVTADFTHVELVEARGKRYQPTSVHTQPGSKNIVLIDLPKVPEGSYRLDFSTRDSLDLHETAGSIVFGVGVAPPTSLNLPQPAPPRPVEFILRWVVLAGFCLLCGGLLFALLLAPRWPVGPARSRVQLMSLNLALAGTALQFVGGIGQAAFQASALGVSTQKAFLQLDTSDYGQRLLVSFLLLFALGGLLLYLRIRARRVALEGPVAAFRREGPLALLGTGPRLLLLAAFQAVALAAADHSSGASGLDAGQVVLRTVHLLGIGLWAGGVVVLAVNLAGAARARLEFRSLAGPAVRSFGPVGAVAFGAIAVSGLLLSGVQVQSITALLTTTYGQVLVAKGALAAVVIGIALRHALITWRSLAGRSLLTQPPRLLLSTVVVEAAGALAIVVFGAVLGSAAPARGPQFEPTPAAVASQVSAQSGELLSELSLQPNRPGPNLLSATVVDTRRPPLAPVSGVTIILRQPGARDAVLPTTQTGTRFDAGAVSLAAGDLMIRVEIHRPGLPDAVIDQPWRVQALAVARVPTVVSSAPFAPLADAGAVLAGLLALFVLGGAALSLRRRRAAAAAGGPDGSGEEDLPASRLDGGPLQALAGSSTAAPRTSPPRSRSSATLAASSGKISTSVRIGIRGASSRKR